jgi:hypothetical protein
MSETLCTSSEINQYNESNLDKVINKDSGSDSCSVGCEGNVSSVDTLGIEKSVGSIGCLVVGNEVSEGSVGMRVCVISVLN